MSKKLPLYAVDKCHVMLRIPVESKVKLEGLARSTGLSVSSLAAGAVCDLVKDREFSAADLMRVNEIITANIRKRDMLKLKKGAL